MSYNLDAIKAKISALSGAQKSGDKTKIKWHKPELGTYDVRFIGLVDEAGEPLSQPLLEIAFYDNKDLGDRRFVAPSQYGLPDPLKEVALELAKDRSKEAWQVRKKLTPRERYYAAIVVRGKEEEGVQIWELSPKLCKDVYQYFVMPDYADEQLFSVENGFDFTVTVSPTDKTFNNHPVKEIKFVPRRKASKLAPKKEQIEALVKQIPNLTAYFKAQVKSEDELVKIRDAFLAAQTDDSGHTESTPEGVARGSSNSDKAVADVNSAFSDLDT